MRIEVLDDLILSVAAARWQKVAMVIAKVTKDTRFSVAADPDEEFDSVAARIQQLVAAGRLVAQGDISDWRHSEIRLRL